MNLPFIDLCKTIRSIISSLRWKSSAEAACVDCAVKSSINNGDVASRGLPVHLLAPQNGAMARPVLGNDSGLAAAGRFHSAACCYSSDI